MHIMAAMEIFESLGHEQLAQCLGGEQSAGCYFADAFAATPLAYAGYREGARFGTAGKILGALAAGGAMAALAHYAYCTPAK